MSESRTSDYCWPGPYKHFNTFGDPIIYYTYPWDFYPWAIDPKFWRSNSSGLIPHCCPVCNGHGTVSRPPWVAGDAESWAHTDTGPYTCQACKGTGIIWEELES